MHYTIHVVPGYSMIMYKSVGLFILSIDIENVSVAERSTTDAMHVICMTHVCWYLSTWVNVITFASR